MKAGREDGLSRTATELRLDYYGLNGEIHLGDARRICSQSDAVATDLPYGINLVQDASRDREILQNIRTLAPKAAFVDVRDLSKELIDLGYRVEKVIPVLKHSILRQIFLTAT